MFQDLRKVVNEIVKLDLIVGIVTMIILLFFGKIYIPFTLLGLTVSIFNFYLSSIIVSSMAQSNSKASASRHTLGYVCRTVLVVSLGLICFIKNKYSIIFYMLGFILHFVGLSLYGIKLQISTRGE